ncbi:MAG: diadenylate cyclase CdaA [Pyrinomonadaceae bacterium]
MIFFGSIFEIGTLRTFVDIAVVFAIVYVLLKLLRGTRAVPMVAGMGLVAFLYWLSISQELPTLEFVLREAIFYIGILIIVLFQSEIRQALIYFGNRIRFPLMLRQRKPSGGTIYDELVLAMTTLSSSRTGALIILERSVGLRNFIDAGVQLDANINYDLLVTIFNPSTPLHDGAVIIRNDRVAAASCFLPLTKNPNISRELGTRHRAAIGVTEGSDAIALVVSEETGLISFIENGTLQRHLDAIRLRKLLYEALGITNPETAEVSNSEKNLSEKKIRGETEKEVALS